MQKVFVKIWNSKITNQLVSDVAISSGLLFFSLSLVRLLIPALVDPFISTLPLMIVFLVSLVLITLLPSDRTKKEDTRSIFLISIQIVLVGLVVAVSMFRSILLSVPQALLTTFLIVLIFSYLMRLLFVSFIKKNG